MKCGMEAFPCIVFLSTLSLRRATFQQYNSNIHHKFLSTLSLRRATDMGAERHAPVLDFYPRSPCGERRLNKVLFVQETEISIHALLAESDPLLAVVSYLPVVFLSTLSLRRATTVHEIKFHLCNDFYPRSPCGERPCILSACSIQYHISIHALLAESDAISPCLLSKP